MFDGNHMKRKDGLLYRLLRLEKSTSVHIKAGKSSYCFLDIKRSSGNHLLTIFTSELSLHEKLKDVLLLPLFQI